MSKIAFVLGNGVSRKSIDCTQLKKHGTVYGCNALYREFSPDYLVAVDAKMVVEITNTGYQLENSVWTNRNRNNQNIENLNFFEKSRGWSSGPTALDLATMHDNTEIYILGFDYIGLNQGENVNNIYADSKNYKRSDQTATYYGNWLRQTRTIIKENQDKSFYRVIDSRGFIPKDLVNINNLEHVKVDEFCEKFM